ncbi:MAG: GntR family transcriptional regulator [Candidatus Aminicenantes bacterium]|nr:GntR family transcriptional regulator [Candidatus Aminicenantes bacterium]
MAKSDQVIVKTLSQSIYNYLKEAIITNDLRANQRIIEKDIAEKFGVSTTPVREALLRLSAEGYVSIDSHRRTLVKQISYQELKDIFKVMADLDVIAIKQVVDHIEKGHIKELKDLTEQMEQKGKSGDIENYLELNTAIHKKIWEILPNKILQKTIEFVHSQLMRYSYSRIIAYMEPAVIKQSMREHKGILRALENKDKRTLKALIRSNWSLLLNRKTGESGELKVKKQKGGENRRTLKKQTLDLIKLKEKEE